MYHLCAAILVSAQQHRPPRGMNSASRKFLICRFRKESITTFGVSTFTPYLSLKLTSVSVVALFAVRFIVLGDHGDTQFYHNRSTVVVRGRRPWWETMGTRNFTITGAR